MAGWHHQLNGHEFEQTRGDSEGQRNLAHCSPWGSQRVRHDLVTEQQQQQQSARGDYIRIEVKLVISLSLCQFPYFKFISSDSLLLGDLKNIYITKPFVKF